MGDTSNDNYSNSLQLTSFDRYDEEFQLLIQQIEKSIMEQPPSIYSINLFQQANDLLKQMSVEARSLLSSNSTMKRTLLDKVKLFKSQIQSLQSEADRNGLLLQNNNDIEQQQQQQQKNNNNTTSNKQNDERSMNMILNQNDILERAKRTMDETETIAFEISEELSHNREKLMSTHNRIREVSGLTGRAKKLLHSMTQRSVQHKMILYCVGIGLVFGTLLLLWSLWS